MTKSREIDLKSIVRLCQTSAIERLEKFGIKDSFQVKLKEASKPYASNFIGQYRASSQFGSGPIIWINPELPSLLKKESISTPIEEVIEDTLLHEYGHVIWEYANRKDPSLMEYIKSIEPDEEEFAETFSLVVKKNATASAYKEIATRYQISLSNP